MPAAPQLRIWVPLSGSTIAQTRENDAKTGSRSLVPQRFEPHVGLFDQRKEIAMDGATIIRVVAGVLFVVVLVVLIQRRRTRVK